MSPLGGKRVNEGSTTWIYFPYWWLAVLSVGLFDIMQAAEAGCVMVNVEKNKAAVEIVRALNKGRFFAFISPP